MDPYLGEIRLFAGNYAPEGWALCDGGTLPVTGYEALFALIGNIYGGVTGQTFALPDLRGRMVIGTSPTPVPSSGPPATSAYALGAHGGTTDVALTPDQLPPHTHGFNATTAAATSLNPLGNLLADPVDTANTYVPYVSTAAMVALNGGAVAPSGNSIPHANMMPSMALTYIIATQGLFPQPGN
ncbi:Microcystin dependent MdpB family protein [Candidatus Terasakiella magnetica]|nr:Microcystin dependent MdpB family protein [Candidatus Terasakiella magnetica]